MDQQRNELPPPQSRFAEVSRRAFLKRTALAAGAAAFFPTLVACGSDADQFAAATTAAGPAAQSTSTAAPTTTTTSPPTTTATTAAPPVADIGTLPQGSEMVINFTYAATDGGGRVRNPYLAVWVEDADGELVNTIALWFQQTQKGIKYLNDLRRWIAVDGTQATVDTISSPTRTPGDYSLVWDGTTAAGEMVAAGEYYICIESAREHGPYSLIRESISIGDRDLRLALPDDGELNSASIDLAVA
jgi:hypothetical protein